MIPIMQILGVGLIGRSAVFMSVSWIVMRSNDPALCNGNVQKVSHDMKFIVPLNKILLRRYIYTKL